MKSPSKRIQTAINTACSLAERYVEEQARSIMRKHPNVKAFIMAMGCAMFEVDGQRSSLGLEERPYFRPLDDFISKWDDMLGITGNPMWITGPDGPVVRQW